MLNQKTFTVAKTVTIGLPLVLVCKKTGYLEHGGLSNGERWCEIGKQYRLTEIRDTPEDSDPNFIMQTESYTEDETMFLSEHQMDYEFMSEFFFVTF